MEHLSLAIGLFSALSAEAQLAVAVSPPKVVGPRFRASIANQLINVPDGIQIKIKISGREN